MHYVNKNGRHFFGASSLCTLGLSVVIILSIFNSNKYGAELKYCFPGVVLFLLGVLMQFRTMIKFKLIHFFAILLVMSMICSTLLSNVVGWTSNARSFALIVFFFIIATCIPYSKQQIKVLLKVYIASSFLCSLNIIYAFIVSLSSFNRYHAFIFTGEKDVNYMTAYILPCLSICFYMMLIGAKSKKSRMYFNFLTGMMLLSVFIATSRSAFITAAVCFAFIVIKYLRVSQNRFKKFFIAFFIILVVGLVLTQMQSNEMFSRLFEAENYQENIRFQIWDAALIAFRQSPIIGSGLGAASFYSRMYMAYSSHNNYIDILGNQGVIGILIFISMFVQLMRVKKTNIDIMGIAMISFFLPMAFINGYETFTFWTSMIICQILCEYLKKNDLESLLTETASDSAVSN